MERFTLIQGDLLPEITAVARDTDGSIIDLTGATLKFYMSSKEDNTNKIDATAAVVDIPTGAIKYAPAGTDTDTPGYYNADFRATKLGKVFSFPNGEYIQVTILAKLK